MDVMDEFTAFDHGYRAGMFDECNGRDLPDYSEIPDTIENEIYVDGYIDGRLDHTRMI